MHKNEECEYNVRYSESSDAPDPPTTMHGEH